LWHTSLLDNDLIKAEFLGGTFENFFFNGILIRERDEVTDMYLLLIDGVAFATYFSDKSEYLDLLCLTDTMRPIHGL
jgi:hypothetical protein